MKVTISYCPLHYCHSHLSCPRNNMLFCNFIFFYEKNIFCSPSCDKTGYGQTRMKGSRIQPHPSRILDYPRYPPILTYYSASLFTPFNLVKEFLWNSRTHISKYMPPPSPMCLVVEGRGNLEKWARILNKPTFLWR